MTEPPANLFLILFTCSVSIWGFNNREKQAKFVFRPEDILAGKEYYRLVSSAFLHANWAHLLANTYSLYCFGPMIERLFGPLHFLLIYFSAVVGGSLLSLYVHRHHDYAAYGASGGVCGMIFAYIVMFPQSRLPLFPFPVAVPAWLYALAFMIASFFAMKSQQDNVGHDAHLGGAVIGLLVASLLQPEIAQRNWQLFVSVVVLSGALLTYLMVNPLFLPMRAVVTVPSWLNFRFTRQAKKEPRRHPSQPAQTYPKTEEPEPERDWLIQQIEEQVGKLEKDSTGRYDWIDKFGRTYDVLGPTSQDFTLPTFRAAVMDRLNTPGLNFVIVDTRQLQEGQVLTVRPFLSNLPDNQFNRVIRSYAFPARKRR